MDEKAEYDREMRIGRLKFYLGLLRQNHGEVPRDVKGEINDRIESIKKGDV